MFTRWRCCGSLIFNEFFNLGTCWAMHTFLLFTMQVNGNCNGNSHFRLLLRNRQPEILQTWWGCALGGSLPSLFKWSWSNDFWIFYEFFCSFLGKILKNLLLQNRLANCFEIAQGHIWGPPDLKLFNRWRCDFFQFFYEFFCVFAIFDFFSKTVTQIVLKLGGYVPCGRVTQGCSTGGIAVDP